MQLTLQLGLTLRWQSKDLPSSRPGGRSSYQIWIKQQQQPELAGHQAVEDEVEGAVDEGHHVHQLSQRCVTVHEELSAKYEKVKTTNISIRGCTFSQSKRKCKNVKQKINLTTMDNWHELNLNLRWFHLFPKGSREDVKDTLKNTLSLM